MTTLREIVENAASSLGTYVHPDISECQDRLSEIIIAAKLGGISHDNLVGIEINRGKVTVHTTYSVRSCAQEGLFEFPEHILDAEDPIKAATIWGLEAELEEEIEKRDEARHTLALYEKRVTEAEKALSAAATQ
jgi:hypothetical protein